MCKGQCSRRHPACTHRLHKQQLAVLLLSTQPGGCKDRTETETVKATRDSQKDKALSWQPTTLRPMGTQDPTVQGYSGEPAVYGPRQQPCTSPSSGSFSHVRLRRKGAPRPLLQEVTMTRVGTTHHVVGTDPIHRSRSAYF